MEKSHKFDELGNLILYSFLSYIDESAKSNISHGIETFDQSIQTSIMVLKHLNFCLIKFMKKKK